MNDKEFWNKAAENWSRPAKLTLRERIYAFFRRLFRREMQ